MSNGTTTAACLLAIQEGVVPKPDPDISGNGVYLAFLLSAYLSFALVLLAYAAAFVEPSLLNEVDRLVFRIKPYRGRHPVAHKAMTKAILAMGDQQIVTGIAILGAGFQGLRTGGISVYHYQIVLYLAWMSSSVHLSALTILGAALTRNPGLMAWRVAGMLVLLILLLVALIPTISNEWGLQYWDGMLPGRSGWGIPAKCFWARLWGDGVNSDSVLGFVILGVSYVWKVGALFPRAGHWYNRWIRHPLENRATKLLIWTARRYSRGRKWYTLLLFRLTVTLTLPLYATLAMLASFAASLWLSVLGLVFGTMQVVIPRQQNLWYTASKEESWDFGQLVPLILLVQPLGAVAEHVYPGAHHHHGGEGEGQRRRASRDSLNLPPLGRGEEENCPSSSSDSAPHSPSRDPPTLLALLSTSASNPSLLPFIYRSRLFTLTTFLINAAILATAILVYIVDAISIGNAKVPKWELTAECIGCCILGIWVIVGVCAPFSRLGRVDGKVTGWTSRRWERGKDDGGGGGEEEVGVEGKG